MTMFRIKVPAIGLLLCACGSETSGPQAGPKTDRYVQSSADRKLFANDPQRQAARTIMLGGCTDNLKQTLAGQGYQASDTIIADACGCLTDQGTRTLSTAQILAGEVRPDEQSCKRWLPQLQKSPTVSG